MDTWIASIFWLLWIYFHFYIECFVSFQGKKLPYHLGDDAEEGDVSDEDSADEIEDECKFKLHYVSDRLGPNFYLLCAAVKVAAVLESSPR